MIYRLSDLSPVEMFTPNLCHDEAAVDPCKLIWPLSIIIGGRLCEPLFEKEVFCFAERNVCLEGLCRRSASKRICWKYTRPWDAQKLQVKDRGPEPHAVTQFHRERVGLGGVIYRTSFNTHKMET
jgi:hypothetical protein